MILLKLIISGFVMGLISALPVGPSALEIVRRGVCYGFLAAFLVALGTVTSDIVYSLLALFGVSNFLINNNIAQDISGGIAATVVAIYGVYIIYEANKNQNLSIEKSEKKELPAYLSGLGLTIFNPFVLIFWAGVVSLVYGSSLVDGSQFKAGIFIISAITGIIIWTLLLSYLASLGKIKLSQKFRRNIDVTIGIVLILTAVIILGKLFII